MTAKKQPPSGALSKTKAALWWVKNRFFVRDPWMRFLARNLDLLVYSFIIGFILVTLRPAYALHGGFLLSLFLFLSWFLIEPILLCTVGTTLGKFLFNIEVRDTHHRIPTFLHALRRSLSVWSLGYGIGLPIIAIFTLPYSYYTLVKKGKTLWDRKEFIVRCGSISYLKAIIAAFVFACIFGLCFVSLYISINRFSPQAVERDIATLNSQLPTMVDNDTQLTNVTLQDNTIVYRYTLINTDAAQLDLAVFASAMRGLIVNQVCTNSYSLQLLKMGYAISFNYSDKNEKPVAAIPLDFADCQ